MDPPVPCERIHTGLRVTNPYRQRTRIREHHNVAYRLVRTAIGIAKDRATASALMNMAGDIYCTLVKDTSSKNMRVNYCEAASICYEKAFLICRSTPEQPYVDKPMFVHGLKYHI